MGHFQFSSISCDSSMFCFAAMMCTKPSLLACLLPKGSRAGYGTTHYAMQRVIVRFLSQSVSEISHKISKRCVQTMLTPPRFTNGTCVYHTGTAIIRWHKEGGPGNRLDYTLIRQNSRLQLWLLVSTKHPPEHALVLRLYGRPCRLDRAIRSLPDSVTEIVTVTGSPGHAGLQLAQQAPAS